MESGGQEGCKRHKQRKTDELGYESEREKVREDTESDGTKGNCVLGGSQVCYTDGP